MKETPRWMRVTLWAAAIYNLVWGFWVIARPDDLFVLAGIDPPNYPGVWQCVGMIVGVYGIGYACAALDPMRHWPIVLVGLLGKIFGPIGFFSPFILGTADQPGQLPLSWGWTIVTNDLIWWIPFSAILYLTFKSYNEPSQTAPLSVAQAGEQFRTQHGSTLKDLSSNQTLMMVFLRHSGCTFCREALADLGKQITQIRQQGVEPVIVHMGKNTSSDQSFARYGLSDLHRVSDPACQLYRAYDLGRGRWSDLFGPSIWRRGFLAAIVGRHGVGKLGGDGFQLGGLFLIRDNRIVYANRYRSAAERPIYCQIATETT